MSDSLAELHRRLRRDSPQLVGAVFERLAPTLFSSPPYSPHARQSGKRVRDFNDPIWKTVTLEGVELDLVDLPLMQRLRRVRQLGLAHLVFPGANHSRLEHCVGALEAAKRIFDRLALTSTLQDSHRSRFREIVSVAALVHDCGHPVFSHVGERVLQSLFRTEFETVLGVLDEFFKDEVAAASHRSARLGPIVRRKVPPAAELLSALLVLSPAMQAFLARSGMARPDEAALVACGLVIGRPLRLMVKQEKTGRLCFYHFIKAIVSGDLDADKIDYVARDAYFAGMPISADTTRLLSQMAVADLNAQTESDHQALSFSPPGPEHYELLGVRPAGCSALEMFVMTRSYLFERIYCHHKVRAAERTLERLLRQRLALGVHSQGWDIAKALEFLFQDGGDDAVLAILGNENLPEDKEGRFREFSRQVLVRDLPQRALALSPRFLVDYRKGPSKQSSGALGPWDHADSALRENANQMEAWICAKLGLKVGHTVYIDPAISNPIKESPDIWVTDRLERQRILRVNRFFDVEQLANAYHDVKQVTWIFSAPADRVRVAAAAAVYLAKEFDLVVGEEALRPAKIARKDFEAAMAELKVSLDADEKAIADDLLRFNADTQRIRPVPRQFETALACLDEADRKFAARRLASQCWNAGISRSNYDDFIAALEVLAALVRYAKWRWASGEVAASKPGSNESRFQDDVLKGLREDREFNRLFEVTSHPRASGGITDLVITSRGYRDIVVELKSEPKRYLDLVAHHAGQPSRYAEETQFARVSFLFCQFSDDSHHRLADTLLVRVPPNTVKSPHAIVCLGVKGFAKKPSEVGSATVPAGPSLASKGAHGLPRAKHGASPRLQSKLKSK